MYSFSNKRDRTQLAVGVSKPYTYILGGVRQFAGDAEIAVRAVQAGNDMLCCTDFEVQVPAVIKAVETGEITEERLNESVLRILKMKIKLGIITDYQNFSQ